MAPFGELDEVDREFRRGLVVLTAPPTRFYLNLTETCKIRCRHCITSAPSKTEDGSGRVMSKEVLDRIAPHLRFASYVGLTHAGEPITAPMFAPLLESLRAARGGAATVVHVLTNGLALTERRFVELIRLGVSSWSISVDGMSAATHDTLRIGSKIDRLTERIERLSALRRARFERVRMGISWTVTAWNLGEIEALVRFAKRAGLDWVKLEEVAPVNGVACEALAFPEEDAARAIASAKGVAAELGLPILDHTKTPRVFKCLLEGDRAIAEFSRLDDFANRMEINTCRFPYEAVFIEPNGDVKAVDFHHRVAGNLFEQDLSAIWNDPLFILERSNAKLRRPCGFGAPTCPKDPGPEAW
jgi:cyclomaltodextrinase / maltogenic alpha-amylase / neopullulanase